MRDDRNFKCLTSYHSLQADGDHDCWISISVTCEDYLQCAFHLSIDPVDQEFNVLEVPDYEHDASEDPGFDAPAPGPILTGEYINGHLDFEDQIKFYFFPFDYRAYGLPTVLLNKTKMSGQSDNGDTYMIATVQPDIQVNPGNKYQDWDYPSNVYYQWQSKSEDPN